MSKGFSEYELPTGWTFVLLEEIIQVEYGKSLVGKDRQKGKFPVYGSNGVIEFHNQFIAHGPVIIIGRKGTVGSVHYSNENCWPIDTTYYVKAVPSLNSKFLFYTLKSLGLERLSTSTTIPGLNRNKLYKLKIALPPLLEQYRILEKVEELFSKLEHAHSALKKALKQLELYREVLLKNAFDGKLPFINIKEAKSWKWVKIRDIAEVIMGQSPAGESYNQIGVGTPLINGPTEFGPTPFSGTLLSKWTTAPNSKRSKLGDLILCVRGSTTGRQNIAAFDACIGRGVAAIRAVGVMQQYLNHYINYSRKRIFDLGTGTTFPSISREQLKNFPFPACSKEEQEYIVQEIEYRYTVIDHLETTIKNNLRIIEAFKQSILKRAFRGQLVPQDISDEPASLLVSKIKEEKEQHLIQQKAVTKETTSKSTIMDTARSIEQVLQDSEAPMQAKDVWLQSEHKDDIEEFYAELKELGAKVKEIKSETESFLKLSK
jgi:type I restriction enzyme S subunit